MKRNILYIILVIVLQLQAFGMYSEKSWKYIINESIEKIQSDEDDSRLSSAMWLAGRRFPGSIEPLKSLLKDDNPLVVRVAIIALGEIADQRAYNSILQLSSSTHPGIRNAIAQALGKFRNASSCQILYGMATNDNEELDTRKAAMRSLALISDKNAMDILIDLSNQLKGELFRECLIAICKSSNTLKQPYVTSALNSKDADIRIIGIQAVIINPSREYLDQLLHLVGIEKEKNVILEIIDALGCFKDYRVEKILGDLIKDNDEDISKSAIQAVGKIGRWNDSLSTALESKLWTVRGSAIVALGDIDDIRSKEKIVTLLHDDDYLCRNFAILAIVNHSRPEFLPSLINIAKHDRNIKNRREAVKLLSTYVNDEAEQTLIDILINSDDALPVRLAAVQNSNNLSVKYVNTLIDIIEDKKNDIQLRTVASWCLNRECSDDVIDRLCPIIVDPNIEEDIKVSIAVCFLENKSKSTIPFLINFLNESQTNLKFSPRAKFFAADALLEATGEDFGMNVSKWEEWYKLHKIK